MGEAVPVHVKRGFDRLVADPQLDRVEVPPGLQLVTAMQARLGVLFPHMTDLEEFGWEPGDYTEQCYRAAGWGDLDSRYWIGTTEARRRLGILETAYDSAGVHDNGRRHDFTFADEPRELVAA